LIDADRINPLASQAREQIVQRQRPIAVVLAAVV
jgi:hypothetical protein